MSIISILRGSRQRDHEFKANLRYTANPSLKTTTKIHQILELSRVYKAKSPGPLTPLGGSAFIGHATAKCGSLTVKMSHLEEHTVTFWVEGQKRMVFDCGHGLCPSLRRIF